MRAPFSGDLRRIAVFRRWLHLHEFQSKRLLESYGLPIQNFALITHKNASAAVIKDIVNGLPYKNFVVKAQILAGARAKGTFVDGTLVGGVYLRSGAQKAEVERLVDAMLGKRLVTSQTGPEGERVDAVTVAEAFEVARELYVCFLLDGVTRRAQIVASTSGGGNDIEACSVKTPERVRTFAIADAAAPSLHQDQVLDVARFLLPNDAPLQSLACAHLQRLFRLFVDFQCTQLEINPYVVTPDQRLVCFDAKIAIDDAAAFRIDAWSRLLSERRLGVDSDEEPFAGDTSFVPLGGDVGCVVNGAGLAMATADLIAMCGGSPANFLDVGGGATEARVSEAVTTLLKRRPLNCVFVNVFGGIIRCDAVARAIVSALNEAGDPQLPVVLRLCGTNAAEALEALRHHEKRLFIETEFGAAARLAVRLAADRRASRQSASN